MLMHFILSVRGTMDPARLRSALSNVLSRHPGLGSTIRAAGPGTVREPRDVSGGAILTVWDLAATKVRGDTPEAPDRAGPQSDGGGARAATGSRQALLSEWMNQPLDPRQMLPWRVLLLVESPAECSLVFTLHHAVADGVRALRVVHEVVREYNGTVPATHSGRLPAITRSDELLALARSFRRSVKHFYLRMAAGLAHRFLVAPLLPRARICRATSRASPRISFCQASLAAPDLAGVRSRAGTLGVRVNDVLLAACFRTVEHWNRVHGRPSRRISIMVPVDVSAAGLAAAPANQASFISVPTSREERSDPDELARRVGHRTSRMLENGMAFTMVYAAWLCTRVPPRVSRSMAWLVMATRVCLDTILLTNLGRIWPEEAASMEGVPLGTARIDSVVALPPVASPMGLSLCAGTYRDRLHFTLTYKTSQFSEAQARAFLGSFLENLRSYRASPHAAA